MRHPARRLTITGLAILTACCILMCSCASQPAASASGQTTKTTKSPATTTKPITTYRSVISTTTTTDPSAPKFGKTDSLTDTYWALQSYGKAANLTRAISGYSGGLSRTITLNFTPTEYMGTDGNGGNYGGSRMTNNQSIWLGTRTLVTKFVQDDPPGFPMEYGEYFRLLETAHDFKQTTSQLILYCGDYDQLVFVKMTFPGQSATTTRK
jgi:hypothetical protein